ncbi:MAG: response regulator transcription factor [Salibacteraceae bacterium]|nr:response regulator transcription factor [Salibacteraceae bacterium]|tara:strand:- start:8906 stop:9601 length:696 start_codon:yes stop_codon:yes gene_type:complete
MKTIRLAIVDDQELVRKGFKLIISSFIDMAVAFEAKSGRDLLLKLKALTPLQLPHIILLDLSMEDMDGVETAKILSKSYPNIHVVILSMHYSPAIVNLMISLNACAYFKKNTNSTELEKGLRKIADKGNYFTEEVYEMIRKGTVDHSKAKKQVKNEDLLTERERQVLDLICQEYETKEIAEMLDLGMRTIETHRRNLLVKTKARNMAGIVIYAISNNLYNPSKSNKISKLI